MNSANSSPQDRPQDQLDESTVIMDEPASGHVETGPGGRSGFPVWVASSTATGLSEWRHVGGRCSPTVMKPKKGSASARGTNFGQHYPTARCCRGASSAESHIVPNVPVMPFGSAVLSAIPLPEANPARRRASGPARHHARHLHA